jgi:hypothetical protein
MGDANSYMSPDWIQQVAAMVCQASWLIHKCIVNVENRQGCSGRIAINNAYILTTGDKTNPLTVDSLGGGNTLWRIVGDVLPAEHVVGMSS